MDIVIPDDYPPTYANFEQPDLQRLAPYGAVRLYTSRAADRDELFARLSSAEVVINVRAYTALDEEAFAHAPALRMISILGTGTDNVDLAAAARRGITVTNTPAVGAPSVAELTLGLILAGTLGNNGYGALTGYDYVTGLGSPLGNQLVPALGVY